MTDKSPLQERQELGFAVRAARGRIQLLQDENSRFAEQHDQDQALLRQLLAERPVLSRERTLYRERAEAAEAELARRDEIARAPMTPKQQAALDRLIAMFPAAAPRAVVQETPRVGHMTLDEHVAGVLAMGGTL